MFISIFISVVMFLCSHDSSPDPLLQLSLAFIVSYSLHLLLLTIFFLLPSSFLHLSSSAAAGQPMGGGYGGQTSGGARPSEQGSTGEK